MANLGNSFSEEDRRYSLRDELSNDVFELDVVLEIFVFCLNNRGTL